VLSAHRDSRNTGSQDFVDEAPLDLVSVSRMRLVPRDRRELRRGRCGCSLFAASAGLATVLRGSTATPSALPPWVKSSREVVIDPGLGRVASALGDA
jgi:hypothetical protein